MLPGGRDGDPCFTFKGGAGVMKQVVVGVPASLWHDTRHKYDLRDTLCLLAEITGGQCTALESCRHTQLIIHAPRPTPVQANTQMEKWHKFKSMNTDTFIHTDWAPVPKSRLGCRGTWHLVEPKVLAQGGGELPCIAFYFGCQQIDVEWIMHGQGQRRAGWASGDRLVAVAAILIPKCWLRVESSSLPCHLPCNLPWHTSLPTKHFARRVKRCNHCKYCSVSQSSSTDNRFELPHDEEGWVSFPKLNIAKGETSQDITPFTILTFCYQKRLWLDNFLWLYNFVWLLTCYGWVTIYGWITLMAR